MAEGKKQNPRRKRSDGLSESCVIIPPLPKDLGAPSCLGRALSVPERVIIPAKLIHGTLAKGAARWAVECKEKNGSYPYEVSA